MARPAREARDGAKEYDFERLYLVDATACPQPAFEEQAAK